MPARLSRPRLLGFTLLELIVTIVVLGVLAALAVPAFSAVIDRSKDEALTAELEALGRGISALAAFDGELTEATAAEFVAAEGSAGTQIAASDRWTVLTGTPATGATAGEIVGELYIADASGFLGAATVVPHDPARVAFLLVGASGGHAETTVLADVVDVTGADALCFYGVGVKDDGTVCEPDPESNGGTSTVGGASGGGGTALSGGTTSTSELSGLIADDFNRTDVILDGSFTSVGNAQWVALRAGHAIVAGQVEGDGDDLSVVDAGIADVDVRLTLTRATFTSGIAFRVQDTNNMWLFRTSAFDDKWVLSVYQAGTHTVVASGPRLPDGTVLSVTASGDLITVGADGTELARTTSAALQTATHHGVYTSANSSNPSGQVDDFVIDEAPLPAPTGVTADAGDGEVTVAWSGVTGAAAYRVYVDDAATAAAEVSDPTATATVTGLTNGTSYRFAVSSVASDGTESHRSAEVHATPSASTVLAADNFDRADGPLKDSTTSTGGLLWSVPSATAAPQIVAGQAEFSAGWAFATVPAGVADLTISGTFTVPSDAAHYAGLLFRYQNDNNHWRASVYPDRVDLGKRVGGGAVTVVKSVTHNVTTGGTVPVSVTATGSTITMTVGNQAPVSVTDTALELEKAAGLVGNAGTTATPKVDDFEITQ